jgi:hypothetical protein
MVIHVFLVLYTTDVDECSNKKLFRCPANALCINTYGKYRCECKHGFSYIRRNNTCQGRDTPVCVVILSLNFVGISQVTIAALKRKKQLYKKYTGITKEKGHVAPFHTVSFPSESPSETVVEIQSGSPGAGLAAIAGGVTAAIAVIGAVIGIAVFVGVRKRPASAR